MSRTISITTARGITCDVVVFGSAGASPVVAFHGFGGHLGGEPTLAALGERHEVFAPVWPGFGALGWRGRARGHARLRAARRRRGRRARPRPSSSLRALVRRHDRRRDGGTVTGRATARVGLVAPMGLWLDDHPIPDIYSMLPYDFPVHLFHDPATASRAHGRRGLRGSGGGHRVPHPQQPPAGHRRQGAVPDPQPATRQAPLSRDEPRRRRVGCQRSADAAGVRRAMGRAAAARGRHDGRRGRAHGAV